MRLAPVPPSQPRLRVAGTCPSASAFAIPLPERRPPRGWHGGLCSPCSPTATRLSPAQRHLHLRCRPPLATSSRGWELPRRGCLFLAATAATPPHPHAAAGSARGAPGQAAPPGIGGEAGLRQAEDGGVGGGRNGEGWEGALVCVARTHLSLCSITLGHRLPVGRQLGLSVLLLSVPGGPAAPPPGGFCHRYKWVGWGRAGGETRQGWGRGVCALEKVPQDGAGWGSPIYVPAEEMVLHQHVLHPFLQWLLLLLLQDDSESRVSAPHPEKGRLCLRAAPKPARVPGPQTEQPPALPTSAQPKQGEALRFGEQRGREGLAISLCPSWAGAGSTLCQRCPTVPGHSLPRQGKRPHPQPPAPARGGRGWAGAQSWEREAVSEARG